MLNPPSIEQNTAFEQPPPDGILDRAGLFQRSPEIRANIAGHIRQLREERGFLIYILIESVFVQGDPQTMAAGLREKWIPDGNGLVFVFEVDSRQFSVGQRLEQTVTQDGSIEGVPSYVTTAVLAQASADAKKNPLSPEGFLDVFVTRVADGLNGYFHRKDSPLPEGRTLRLGMIIV
ncbi:MAG TPA: TPM domain-containing protein, partial [Luteolibacter sp.]|nr:TPM domain-containing protein [Luteolibacter sp.]